MHLVFALLVAAVSWADTPLEITHDTAVYQATSEGARVLFHVKPGDEVQASPARDEHFWHVRVHRGEKWSGGYLRKSDLEDELSDAMEKPEGRWSFGLTGIYVDYNQGGRSFQTEDQVQYTTAAYKSTSFAPGLVVQMDDHDFWRATLSLKKTHYTSAASTDVQGGSQAIDLEQTFISLLLQKGWALSALPWLYYGGGVEGAKATSVKLNLGSRSLPTTSQDEPLYIGAQVFAGAKRSLAKSLSIYGEFRFEYIMNQSPGIIGLEGAVGLLYWP